MKRLAVAVLLSLLVCPVAMGHARKYPCITLKKLAYDRARGIPSSVFTIIDLRYPDMLQSFGLIRSNLLHAFIYKRPSYYVVQHMAGFFDDTVEPVGELVHDSSSPRQMTVAGFQKEGTSVVLVWYCDKIPSDDLTWDLKD